MESQRLWVVRSKAVFCTLLNFEQKHPLEWVGHTKVQILGSQTDQDASGSGVRDPKAGVEGFMEEGTGLWEADRDSGSNN